MARYNAMQALWAKDAFLKSGAGGAGGSGELFVAGELFHCSSMHLLQSTKA